MTSATITTTPASDETSIGQLLDFHQIIDALYRFGAGQDWNDRGLFESAFSETATLDFTQPARRFGVTIPPFEGRTHIADTVFATTAGLDTTHTITNPRVTVAGDLATLRALVEAQHVTQEDPGRHLLLKNRYEVGLSRAGDNWLIDRLVIENVWFTGEPTVLFPSAG
jgi:ketosteroid isomerase-like protein